MDCAMSHPMSPETANANARRLINEANEIDNRINRLVKEAAQLRHAAKCFKHAAEWMTSKDEPNHEAVAAEWIAEAKDACGVYEAPDPRV